MKQLSSIVKKEFLDLFRNRSLVHVLFLGFLVLDGLCFLFPDYFINNIVAYIFYPFLLLVYGAYAKERRFVFILAIMFNALGEYLFSNTFETYNPMGLVFHGLSFFIYTYMLYNLFGLISLKVIVKFSVPMVLFIWLPTWVFSKGMCEQNMFNEVLFYVFAITLYIFSVFALNSSIKSKCNRYLLASVCFFIANGYLGAYNVFVFRNEFSIFIGDLFVYLAHYLICWFFVIYHKSKSIKRNEDDS